MKVRGENSKIEQRRKKKIILSCEFLLSDLQNTNTNEKNRQHQILSKLTINLTMTRKWQISMVFMPYNFRNRITDSSTFECNITP